jgi:hypothetical protein
MPLAPEKYSVALMAASVAELLHADKYIEAAQYYADWTKQQTNVVFEVKNRDDATGCLTLLLHWLLANDGYEEAANLLWGRSLFDPRPESAQRVWRAFEEHNFILLMGAASMSKSYSMGVRLMLEWVADPEYTNVKVLGPSEDHLEANLFTHLVTLHRQSSIPLPGEIGKLFIGLDSRSRKGAITGVIIPLGKKAAGRIQGSKRVNRKKPHPKFGTMSRMFIFLDEIANIPVGVWRDIDNVVASSQGDDGLKVIGAFNPTDPYDEVGKRVEPPQGWREFDPDKDLDWVSTRDWRVVRLDAARCENVVAGEIIYPGLQTKSGFEKLIKNSGGVDSPGYWSMGRGCFPPTGAPMSIIPPGLLTNLKAEVIWYDKPTPVGAVDMALQGGDVAVFCKGSFGRATGLKYASTLDYPTGRIVNFKDPKGRTALKNILHAETMLKLPRGDTVATKDEVKRVARSFGIRPEHLCLDRTGNGQGVFDLLRHEFGEVIGVNYSESASETKVMVEDQGTAYELFDRVHTELWFATRGFVEFEYLKVAPGFDMEDLTPQLTGRRYRMSGRKRRVETKEDYKLRCNGKSPDEADSFTLLVHCARKAFGFIPGMALENSVEDNPGDADDGELVGVRIDVTNRFDDI